jgi:hypothetical protein
MPEYKLSASEFILLSAYADELQKGGDLTLPRIILSEYVVDIVDRLRENEAKNN